jgi:16S rRNA (cytidine1402-2'-O)-methyltransferase
VCRELTKLHEQVVRGTLGALAAQAADGTIPTRGELVVVVGWGSGERVRSEAAAAADDALVAARAEVERLTTDSVPRGEAAKRVAAATGIPRRALYGEPGGR